MVQPRRIHSVDIKRYKSNIIRKGHLQQKTKQNMFSESKRLPLQQEKNKKRRNDHSIITMIPYYIERIQRS